MADYGYNSYDFNTGEYEYTSYAYDVVPFQPEFVEYYPNTHNNRYDSSQFEISYSAYSLTDSKAISYNLSSQTQYLISYSTSEFNEPDFVEYDPTPYDGGYDIALTYGKPLPPSDDICYPRTTQTANDLSLDGFSFASIPSPYGKPIITSKPIEVREDDNGSNGGALVGPIIEGSNEGEEREGYIYPNYDYGYPWSGYDYDYGRGNGNGNGSGRSGWYEEKAVPETTYSDTLEICESLFGYWPCLSKKNRKMMDKYNQGFCGGGEGGSNSNPWEQTADYLFGSPVLGYEGRYNGNGSFG